MNMTAIQTYIGAWARRTFPSHTTESICLHHLREAVELCMAAGVSREGVLHSVNRELSNEKNTHKDVTQEMADCGILLFVLADFLGGNLAWAVTEKMDKNQRRTWQLPDEQGVHEHVRG
jgi:NTP pyrophosphatase (non-canonical NTP hydrolase)